MKYNLICYGWNPWSEFWKRNQIMASYLAKEKYIDQVLFINPAIWFEHVICNPFKEFNRLRLSYWKSVFPRRLEKNVTVYTPLFLPKMVELGERYVRNKIAHYIQKHYILLVNLPIAFDSYYERLFQNCAFSIFDWSDDFSQFEIGRNAKKKSQEKIDILIKNSDIVLAVNESLAARAKKINKNSFCIRNATNLGMFPALTFKRKKNKRPVIGYTGWLVLDRLDVELIHFCARSLPAYDFLFVGPKVSSDPLCLKKAPRNIYYQRAVKYEKLAEVIDSFDVCIIPNKVNEYTKGNDPIKIYDYLYMGKPVVTTPTAGVSYFSDWISICATSENFVSSIKDYIEYDTPEAIGARKKAVCEYSWDKKINFVLDLIKKEICPQWNLINI